jgi:hypothetical protein
MVVFWRFSLWTIDPKDSLYKLISASANSSVNGGVGLSDAFILEAKVKAKGYLEP